MSRNKKPPQLKVLEGSFRGDRDTHGAGLKKPIGMPTCPSWLPKSAKTYWTDIGPKLVESGLISVLDQAAFSSHCDSYAKFAEITKKLKRIEDLVDCTPNGLSIQSCLFTIRNKLWDQVRSSSSDFGLNPVSASKVHPVGQTQLSLGGFEEF